MKNSAIYQSYNSHDCEAWYKCPVCDFFYMTNGTTNYNFCPNCGAKMDRKE